MKISSHGAKRYRNRLNKGYRDDVMDEAEMAYQRGKLWYQVEDQLTSLYLHSKGESQKVKLYNNTIWVFTGGKKLLTCYKLPNEEDMKIELGIDLPLDNQLE